MPLLSALGKLKGKRKRPAVYLIRHGKTHLNGESGTSPDRIRGWMDVPLSPEGKRDVKEAAKDLAKIYPDDIVCSDLKRAVETAKIIRQAIQENHADLQLHITRTEKLRPWNLGDFQGKETEKVLKELKHYEENETETPKGGEPFKTFRLRFLKEFKALLDCAAREGCIIFVVAHFRNAKCAEAWDAAGRPADLSIETKVMMDKGSKPGEFDIYYPDAG